ncbi:Gfo/Idh/MocA family protein [Paludibaculum fermentans]|uniref:Gfo/Idh/MocA family protein n=1 Tax=Paludibaculum fermentans TaxID=1473598 RepID=UPI003EC145E9
MSSRREFLHAAAAGTGAALTIPPKALGANDRIRVGIIGPGARGMELIRDLKACPNTELVAAADIYTGRLAAVQKAVPGVKTVMDYRRLLEMKDVDAVLIATPQHLHCQHFVASLQAGKHVYQEKTMAFTVEHAKKMRTAYRASKGMTVQIGHQSCSFGDVTDAAQFTTPPAMGKITAVHAHMYRNTPHDKPQWSRAVSPDMNPESVLWQSFLGDAPNRAFDANRYVNWRFFWDYSGGNVYENMCHQLCFWYKILNLQIPKKATMTGGLYLWKDGREVPDTMNVALEQPEDLLWSWDSGFGNDYLGFSEDVLGTDGTVSRSERVTYTPQAVNRKDAAVLRGSTPTVPACHMKNFVESIRASKEPNCPFGLGFRVAIACRMAVESYRQGRRVRWDGQREEIV